MFPGWPHTKPSRSLLAVVAAALASVLLALGCLLFYVDGEIAEPRAFSDRLVSSLEDAAVRDVVTARIVDGVIEATSGNALAVRPLVTRAVDSLVDTPVFRTTLRAVAEEAHRALVVGDGSLVLALGRHAAVVLDALRSVSPAVAARVSPEVEAVIAAIDDSDAGLVVERRLLDVTGLRWVVLGLAAVFAGLAVWLASGPRRALVLTGGSLAAAGAILAAAVVVGGVLVERGAAGSDPQRAAVAGVWDALFGDLQVAALVAMAGGMVVMVLSLVAAGGPVRPRIPVVAARPVWAGALAVLAGVAIASTLVARDGPEVAYASPGGEARACNGSAALCERRVDDVIFPATHNSYAAADEPGWIFANQRHGIARQLEDGIRGLLIDVHHGVLDPAVDRVRTDLRADRSDRNKARRALSPEALRVADRVAGRVGAGELEGKPGLYLCHTLCEIGAEPLEQELAVIRDFLERETGEVLVVIVEDYVAPPKIAAAFRRAGLLPYVADLDRDEPMPTLGELVDTGERLIVLVEDEGGVPSWYMPAFEWVQDTPYSAMSPDELSCRRYRGDEDSPVLLLNHWNARFPPRVSDQVEIGGEFLAQRVNDCTAARGIAGALVAVDFYERTGVVETARTLNARRP